MVPTKIFPALLGVTLLLCGGASMAAEYRADEFLGLDLSRAVLSPKPLGPATEFAPVPVQADGDVAKNDHAAGATPTHTAPRVAQSKPAESKTAEFKTAESRISESKAASKTAQYRGNMVAHVRPEKPKGAARTRLAHRHSNPLDAQAFDTRVQTWPCKSGGICDWKQ